MKDVDDARTEWEAANAGDPTVKDLLAAYDERRRETAALLDAAQLAAEPLANVRGWEAPAAGVIGLLAAVLLVVAISQPGGVRGSLPLLIAVVVAGGLGGFLALDSTETVPVPSDECLGDEPQIDRSRPGRGPEVARSGPGAGQPRSAQPHRAGAERWIGTRSPIPATVTGPAPKLPTPTPIVPGVVPDMRKAIPDDLLSKPGVRNFKVQEVP